MPATADSLRDLHLLHQRAKALRDRLTSGPNPSRRVRVYASVMFCASCSDMPYLTPSNRARFEEHSAGAMM